MPILTALNHVTHYKYERPIQLGPQSIRLRPAPHARSHIRSYSLTVHPKDHFINWQQDPFGNYLARLVFPQKTQEFRIEVDLVTEIRVFNPLDFFLDECAENYPIHYDAAQEVELAPYLELKEQGPLLQQFVSKVKKNVGQIIPFLVACNEKVHETLDYMIRLKPGVQTCEETLSLNSGSCRDMAWLLCQILRHCGLASRFTSGYLIQLKQDVKSLDGPSGAEEDFTDLHAWTEVYLPGAGWVGLDPTSGLFSGEGHIPLSSSPNPSTAAPVSGALEECESTMTHEMHVTRIHEDPRITRPLSDTQWKDIQKLGDKVDEDLKKRDVRLTMGGEPTFVSLDDRDGEEWNYAALGPKKEALGDDLLWRLKDKLGSGSVLQYSQGKWYPGEPLPRWAMNCYSRKDKQEIWLDERLLARPVDRFEYDLSSAKIFLEELGKALGIPASYVLEAREDAAHYLAKDQRQPIEGEILAANLYEKKERERLQRLMLGNLNDPVGYVLPLQFSQKRGHWISNRWKFRSGHLLLSPGDSALGLRLPLDALPKRDSKKDDLPPELSPFQQVGALPDRLELVDEGAEDRLKAPTFDNDPNGTVRTALCAEVREDKLYLFLPPLTQIENFLSLLVAIETVAANSAMPIVLEGYPPPGDLRVQQFSLTPDPGVLEVNMPPAATWGELQFMTTTLYEEARSARLSTEKFLVDGRLVGTGGGNHIVVGGAHPKDSPFLRKPDLLRSLITFWQNHPSLSYLFSAQYIGPTSQAPRIDEARHDSLYELDIAFQQIPAGRELPLWLVDRLFRNILVDLTGNTHRAEFCIDKLYSPDGNRGRLGLLELRGFEMTPHPRMNLLQALLVRASIACFWKKPYHHNLISWGTRLHDKYMLPEFVWSDLCLALDTLEEGGYAFDSEWFRPFMEFRFPKFGTASLGPVTLELRYALEPWPILGEEMFKGGVSRSVDSSVERLQVKVDGLIEGRHVLTCNGYPLQLQHTAQKGVLVGGVRYKAWAPSSCLHPTIPIHSPLVFDLIDTVHSRSLGGCKYHVVHQGGRSYEVLPVNANEAEGRRLSRFEEMGHSPGKQRLKKGIVHPDFPYTLDLRRISPCS